MLTEADVIVLIEKKKNITIFNKSWGPSLLFVINSSHQHDSIVIPLLFLLKFLNLLT